ncbi:hypothetical protein [Leptolyngbya sp. KIOST-1]|uniref:hypothetical protein n=1 Tax=Leptolyngbya sp. KIOST-1 TaxID=1229172 RepID=UPI0009077152|nr:hypothetical protein [Leptolyngbya sp. KIOST-1]
MTPLFKKLNLTAQGEILVVNAPTSFEPELLGLEGVTTHRQVEAIAAIAFALVFVTQQAEVDDLAQAIAPRAMGDSILWFAYPKKSSKTYTCEFNRDTGWAVLGDLGFEPVRQVAIDADWSALRFRRVEYIKSMTRNPKMALSQEGRGEHVRFARSAETGEDASVDLKA